MKKLLFTGMFAFLILFLCCCGKHEHTYTETLVDPTCESEGFTLLTCSGCSETEKTNIKEKLGHNMKIKVVYPSRENGGYTVHTCSRCDYNYTENYTDPVDFSTGLAYKMYSGKYYVVGIGSCKDKDIVIPSVSEQGYEVYGIKSNAFRQSFIASVQIEDGVKLIEKEAFSGCKGLKSISYPDKADINTPQFSYITNTNLESIVMPVKTNFTEYFYNGTIPQALKDITVSGAMCENAFSMCLDIKSVTISENITKIPDGAFYCCSSLETVVLHNGITEIGNAAFSVCTSILSFDIPSSVTKIGRFAFSASGICEITLPQNVIFTEEDEGIFRYCLDLTKVNFECDPEVIPPFMFEGCEFLSDIVIPEGVKKIGNGAFKNCKCIFSFSIPSSVESIGGEAFYASGIKNAVLTESLREMGSKAFYSCVHMNEIDLSRTSLTSLKEMTFAYCNAKSIKLPENLIFIGEKAFFYFEISEAFTLPNTVTHIGKSAFSHAYIKELSCPGAVIIEDFAFEFSSIEKVSLKNGSVIGDSAFWGCQMLSQVILPDDIKEIKNSAFMGCTALEEISLPQSIEIIADGAFRECTALKNIVIPENLKKLGNNAFCLCTSLESVTFEGAQAEIGEFAFGGCTALKNAVLPSLLLEIPDGCFSECAIASIEIPETVTSIGFEAFHRCNQLKTVKIPTAVMYLKGKAFFGCTSLESADLSNASVTISESCFENCEALSKLENCENIVDFYYNSFMNTLLMDVTDGMSVIFGILVHVDPTVTTVTIPDTVTRIDGKAFAQCNNLEELIIPNKVIVDKRAFINCTALRRIVFPNDLEVLSAETFASLYHAEEIVFGSEIKIIEENAFEYIKKTCVFTFNGTKEQWQAISGDKDLLGGYRVICNDGVLEGILEYVKTDDLYITLSTDGILTVSGTGNTFSEYPFSNYDHLIKKLVIEEGVTAIPEGINRVIKKCTSLSDVVLPSTLTSFSPEPFRSTEWYKQFHKSPENALIIGTQLLMVSKSAEGNYSVPHGITVIGNYAFCECSKIVGVDIPSTVTEIRPFAFNYCGIKELIIPESVKKIDSLASSCPDLSKIVLQGVTDIGTGIASYCENLTLVIINEGVTSLPINTVYECSNNTIIILPTTIDKVDYSAFWSVKGFIACPNKKIADLVGYRNSALPYVYSETEPTESGLWWHYDENGIPVIYT